MYVSLPWLDTGPFLPARAAGKPKRAIEAECSFMVLGNGTIKEDSLLFRYNAQWRSSGAASSICGTVLECNDVEAQVHVSCSMEAWAAVKQRILAFIYARHCALAPPPWSTDSVNTGWLERLDHRASYNPAEAQSA